MKHIQTLDTRDLKTSVENGGCGECQTSCQSACKTSCGIANQQGENTQSKKLHITKCRRQGGIFSDTTSKEIRYYGSSV